MKKLFAILTNKNITYSELLIINSEVEDIFDSFQSLVEDYVTIVLKILSVKV